MYGHCIARHWIKKWHGRKFCAAARREALSYGTRSSSELTLKSKEICFLHPSPKERRSFSIERSHVDLHAAVDKLEQTGVPVDVSTYASLLCLCVHASDLSCGKRIHGHLKKSSLRDSSYLGSLILQMYIKCGARKEADILFATMQEPNVYSWSHIIGAYATVEEGQRCWQLFDRMQWEGISWQKVTFAHVLSVCCSAAALNRGKQLHTLIVENGFHVCVKLGTALLSMYARCGSLAAARGVFDCMVDKDVVSWNAMIAAYTQQGNYEDALRVFQSMQQEGLVLNRSTFTSTIDACAGLTALCEGKRVHAYVTCTGLDSDIVVATTLVNMYGKCSSLHDSRSVFSRMIVMDVILWNTMIAVCTLQEQHYTTLQLFAQMRNEGWLGDQATFVSVFNSCASKAALCEGKRMHVYAIWLSFEQGVEVGSTIVNMYGKCNDIKEAKKVFDRLEKRDLLAWTSMIAVYAQNEQGKEALQLFNRMQKERVIPDKVAFLSVLPAYASQTVVIEAQLMHTTLCHIGLDCNVEIANALITMYGKCGSLDSAHTVFDMMLERDLISWNAVIAAYAHHGHGKEVLELYNQLVNVGIKPDYITYMSVFLACSHSGLLEEGRKSLVSMTQEHGILPSVEHFDCLIDLLARAGQLDEAESLLTSLQSEPTYSQWLSLLGACRNQLDVERGERAATQAFKLDSSNKSPYILLSNIYALANNANEAEKVMIY